MSVDSTTLCRVYSNGGPSWGTQKTSLFMAANVTKKHETPDAAKNLLTGLLLAGVAVGAAAMAEWNMDIQVLDARGMRPPCALEPR